MCLYSLPAALGMIRRAEKQEKSLSGIFVMQVWLPTGLSPTHAACMESSLSGFKQKKQKAYDSHFN